MTVIPGGASDSAGLTAPREPAAQGLLPARAEGVELIGEMKGSGYREPPALVRRADGQTLQLTRLLYAVLSEIDGQSTEARIAERASARFGRLITAGNVASLIDAQLRPLGLLELADGSQPEVKRSSPLLSLRFKYAVTDAAKTRRLTDPFARLFHPVVVVTVLAVFALVCWWVLTQKGLASATHDAFANPVLLLLVVAVTVLSAGFHEFGHAAAARYGGATPGVMGAGLYLFWPAFYTDVTDSYRLGRAGRVRTDLGGLYFNALLTVVIAGAWLATGWDALLLVVLTQILQMLRQLTPLVRFDGYHVLADVTGVPDLFQRIKPTLLGLLPWRWGSADAKILKPWARAVVSLWVLIVVPMLLCSFVMMVLTLPRVIATAWVSIGRREAAVAESWTHGDLAGGAAGALLILAAALPILGTALILFRMIRQGAAALWRRTEGRPLRRASAVVAAVAVIAVLAAMLWPNGDKYRPIQSYERGTIIDAVGSVAPLSSGLQEGRQGRVAAVWPQGSAHPTADKPELAMVLAPRGTRTRDGVTSGAHAPAWVFPFDKPLPPGAGDNQALAVNTKDGSIVYDVALALVWVEDGSALNTNEAYAFASCKDCGAVAVGFQVILIAGQADVVVPQNLSAAANYNCASCLTYALASQLVLTLDGPLSPAGTEQLTKLWNEIRAFGANIQNVPLSDIQARLSAFKAQILQIIEHDPSAHPAASTAVPSPGTSTEPAGATSAPAGSAAPADGTPAPGTPAAGMPATEQAPAEQATAPATPVPAEPTAPATPVGTATPAGG
ncbi:hypothetical protein KIH31_02310 [Paenarthrobacter sp. DKR-5]|uniref:hypothetical protein n=1 Tax=Paenarthrobacter sp. DKR-5 TaxID=2835535 RepID=UPI001BDBB40B|nr:hypothetical protein [Paenarthrobacter sp. DKR-5]MBT1001425.1 hypothetical protein [Paenarthrobacter sp. DKR-5]